MTESILVPIASENPISEPSSTWPYLFWKQVLLIIACLVPAKTTGTSGLARGQRFLSYFIFGFVRLGEHMWAEQMNERENEWHRAGKGHLHYFQPSHLKLPKSTGVGCHLLEWFIFAPFMVGAPQNKDLILHTLNCGAVLWAGISRCHDCARGMEEARTSPGPAWWKCSNCTLR